MLYALLNGKKTEANPHQRAICPSCGKDVFAKCGEEKINHWSHHSHESCEIWYEPETHWHQKWKLIFGADHSEVVIEKDGIRHIADVQTSTDVIIEFQEATIKSETILDREAFYGERMLWVVNGEGFKNNFKVYYYPQKPSHPNIMIGHSVRQAYGYEPRRSDFEVNKDIRFEWNHARRAWMDAKRVVLLDFGDPYLFKIKEWSNSKYGGGKFIPKASFVEKYGGDKNLLEKWDSLDDQDDFFK
jgi:competence CoiA-like predicted nuclease